MRWLREIWAADEDAEALEHAAPTLAAQVEALFAAEEPSARDVRRTALSVARYLLRARHRPTPFGLFAGITTATVGPRARAEWGTRHTVTARAGAEWLATVVKRLEACPALLDRLTVLVNNTISVRGDRLIVPFQADSREDGTRAVEASLALTDPVRTVLATSRTPIQVHALTGKLTAEFPGTAPERVQQLIEGLIQRRVLLTALQAPSTETDPLAYLLDQLDAADAGAVGPVTDTVRELHAIHAALTTCKTPAARKQVTQRMRALEPGPHRHPLALDLRLDARLALPEAVAREAERAAWALTRVCARPYGAAAWGAYHQKFYERYGIGTMVPLGEVVADSGTGFPEGYPGAAASPRRPQLSTRDDALVRIAQTAVLDGRAEVVLTEELLADLDVGPNSPRIPPHLEIGVRVQAASVEELERGRFQLEVVSVSRGAGVSSGRFLSVLAPDDRAAMAAELSNLPAADADTVPVQLSFPPLLPESAHVTRTPQVLPTLLSVEEHRAQADQVLMPEDLAVACDGRRMYLAAPARGHRVEPVGMHALNLQDHTPPLVRFLTELSRAQCAQVTVFDWGAAAAMPYLPRLRYGRAVLAPARWRLVAADLPRLDRPSADWDAALEDWRTRRRAPRRVFLVEDDRRLFLDLDQTGHRTLLRHHLGRVGSAVLHEAPAPEAYGWCEGRAHEVVLPLKATRAPGWPPLPTPTVARTLCSAQMQTPAASSVLLASVYGDLRRQNTLLAQYLPGLLERLGAPSWWFIRFRDPDQHLRLRIALPDPGAFAETAGKVAAWAEELRAAGLVSDLRFPTSYREMGRWGSGAAWEAAEGVFRADSRAVLTQLREPQHSHQRALVVAHTIAITSAFLGSVEAGTRWLINHVPATAPTPVPRRQFTEAVRLADPTDGWAAMHTEPGGAAIVTGWADRNVALAAYRMHLPGPDTEGIAIDDVLTSLLHTHFVRHVAVNFPEEEVCLYLARAAALAWTGRAEKGKGARP
ncbi:lantibiotic dehydratase [Streptomyces phaeochromogenes]|uniref:lantibiotic dehydratase n=1 Tax=Streptomyces phaeochromogenes TaxID=1923 RepID=UPI0036ACE958